MATPDHTIRTKDWPLIVPAPEADKVGEWEKAARAAVEAFVAKYHDYFAHNNKRVNSGEKELDPFPRVILVPGVGLFGVGASAKKKKKKKKTKREIAADISETRRVITDAKDSSGPSRRNSST